MAPNISFVIIGVGKIFIDIIKDVGYNIFHPAEAEVKHARWISRCNEAHIDIHKYYESRKVLASIICKRKLRLFHIQRLKKLGKSNDIYKCVTNWSWI